MAVPSAPSIAASRSIGHSDSLNNRAWKSTESQVEKNTITFWCACVFKKQSRALRRHLQVTIM